MVRTVAWVLSTLVLLTTGVLGLYDGVTELSDASTPLQHSVTIGVIVYGVLGVVGGAALILRRRSAFWLSMAWTIVVTYVASTAALAYGGPDVTFGAAAAGGLGAALIGAGVVWTASTLTRTPAAPARKDVR